MESKEEAGDGSQSFGSWLQVTVDSGQAGLRLDQFLTQILPSVSRTLIGAAIRNGDIRVDGLCRKCSHRLKEREHISGSVEKPPPPQVTPEHIDFPILYEDDFLIVLSKPPGLVVHPGNGNDHGTLVSGLLYHCQSIAGVGDRLRPGIVHRLDKDTSGIMVVAKQDAVHRDLVESFKNRKLVKEYLTLLHGVPREKRGRLVAPIGRHPVNRQKMAISHVGGRHAVSNWQVLREYAGRYSLVKVTIETGRTHQIRVHMASLGCPVAGDRVYGHNRDNNNFPRQLLHASRLVFRHPVTDRLLDLTADVWPDFLTILTEMDRQYEVGE